MSFLVWLAISPAFADIINVTVNGSVSGSGSVTVACAEGTPGCMGGRLTVPYSFSSSNTSLGAFSDSGSATAPNFPASVSSFVSQDSSATTDTLDIMLMGGHSAANAPLFFASESGSISVSFDLTEASLIDLSGGGFGIGPDVGELLDSQGNVILTLPNSPAHVFADLEPGTYSIEASASGGGSGTFVGNVNVIDFQSSLDASFTALPIPEPKGTPFAALLGALIGACALARTRRI
jgi:hypothetical protein